MFGVVAAFGVGNATQINAVISGVNDVVTRFGGERTRLGNLVMGLILAALVGAMLLGGARRIGIVAERLVPFISIVYILLCAVMLVLRWREVPAAFASIAAGADGIFIETHPDPSVAKSDGANMLALERLEGLLERLCRIRTTINEL